jgi:RnfABCDGE-type electron transport complex G subunit
MSSRKRKKRIENILAAGAIVSLVIAWFIGFALNQTDVTPFLQEALPAAARFEPVADEMYAAYSGDELLGYVALGEAKGYGGPIQVAVAAGLEGQVLGMAVVEHKETPSFFARVAGDDLMEKLTGKQYDDSFRLGGELDAVTGATITSRALVEATGMATRRVAGQQLDLPVSEPAPPPIQFGIPEIAVLLLFAAAYVGHRRGFKYTKQVRWATLLIGLVVLGFWFNVPLSLAKFNSFLLGFWPAWRTGLYWYLLIGGILLIATMDRKNAYCGWFCPFGAAQDCMGAIGGAKYVGPPRKYRPYFKWAQRGLAWLALLLAFLFRNPGISSYEVFGALFDFTGSGALFAMLAIVLVASLFVRRPWCNYLCPLDPIYDVILIVQGWVLELWQRIKPNTKTATP